MDNRILGDPGTAAFQVGKYPFFLLNRLVARYNIIIESKLRTIGLDIPSWRVLMVLGEGSPRAASQLADATVIIPSTLTRVMQRMAASGLVEIRQSVGDARVTEVRLLEVGQVKLDAARGVTSPIYQKVIENLSREDFDRLTDLLNLLHDNLVSD